MIGLEKILLVEDNPKDMELALAALEDSHLANEVAVARDGVEAMDYLRRQGAFAARQDALPVVVLLDLKLPKLNGLEVLARIRADTALKQLPVVVLTSSCEEPDLERCYELGVSAYIVKPVDFEQVMGVIKQIGIMWGIINVPPPSLRRSKAREKRTTK